MRKKKNQSINIIFLVTTILFLIIILIVLIMLFNKKDNNQKDIKTNVIVNDNEIMSKNVVGVESVNTRTDRYLVLGGIGEIHEKSNGIINTTELSSFLENAITKSIPNTLNTVSNYTEDELITALNKLKQQLDRAN